jgi:hypothetical protein
MLSRRCIMRGLVSRLAVLAVALAASHRPVMAVTETLSMDILPEEAGWQLFSSPGGTSATVADGLLTIETPGGGHHQWRSPDSWGDNVNNASGWEVKCRMKIVSSGSVYPWVNVGIRVDDFVHLTCLSIYEDRVYLEGGGWEILGEFPMDTTDDFHTYRLTGRGDSIEVFVDGALMLSVTNTWGPGSPVGTIEFGDTNVSPMSPSVSVWDWLSYATNEPVSVERTSWATVKSLYR